MPRSTRTFVAIMARGAHRQIARTSPARAEWPGRARSDCEPVWQAGEVGRNVYRTPTPASR